MQKLTLSQEKQQCTGLIFRCRVNQYTNEKNEYVHQFRMVPLKKESCSCDSCIATFDSIAEEIVNDGRITILPSIKNGAKYKPEFINISTDYETGYVDDYDIIFQELQ